MPLFNRGYINKHKRHHDPIPCPKRPSPGTQLGRGYTEPQISQSWSARSTSITVMSADTLVRVLTGQGYVSLLARGLQEDQDCQSPVSCEGSPLGFGNQMNIPHYSRIAPTSYLLRSEMCTQSCLNYTIMTSHYNIYGCLLF